VLQQKRLRVSGHRPHEAKCAPEFALLFTHSRTLAWASLPLFVVSRLHQMWRFAAEKTIVWLSQIAPAIE
jgi:hypothetical protein